jgi:hypothetical protein
MSQTRSSIAELIARRLYEALVTQDPDRAISLRDGGGGAIARHDPPSGEIIEFRKPLPVRVRSRRSRCRSEVCCWPCRRNALAPLQEDTLWRSCPCHLLSAECLEHARQCEWYAARTNDEGDRKFLFWRAEQSWPGRRSETRRPGLPLSRGRQLEETGRKVICIS